MTRVRYFRKGPIKVTNHFYTPKGITHAIIDPINLTGMVVFEDTNGYRKYKGFQGKNTLELQKLAKKHLGLFGASFQDEVRIKLK